MQFEAYSRGHETRMPKKKLKSSHNRRASKHFVPERADYQAIQRRRSRRKLMGPADSLPPLVKINKKSRDLKVGDVLKLTKGQRVPADVIILRCLSMESASANAHANELREEVAKEELLLLDGAEEAGESSTPTAPVRPPEPAGGEHGATGETFIRTDQLDGEHRL